MQTQKYFSISKLLGLLITLLISFWVVSLNLKPQYITINLEGIAEQAQVVDVWFFKTGVEPVLRQRTVNNPKTPNTYHFKIPKYYSPEAIHIGLGDEPSNWSINRIGVQVYFFAFGFEGYKWHLSELAQSTRSARQVRTRLLSDHDLSVSTLKKNSRFYFPLDYTKLTSSRELILFKLFFVACIMGLYLFMFSRYFSQLFATRKIDAEQFRQDYLACIKSKKIWMICGGLLLPIAVITLRYSYLLYPGLYIEDTLEFSDALTGDISLLDPTTYRYTRGYLVFLSELMVQVSSLFPLHWQPYLYAGIAIFFLCLSMIAIAYSGLFTSKLFLLIVPTALWLICFTEQTMYLSITGLLFTSVALLFAVVLRPSPTKLTRLVPYLILVPVLVFSGPYSTQLLPFSLGLLLLISTGTKNLVLIATILSVVLYTLCSNSGLIVLSNLLDFSVRASFFNTMIRSVFLLDLFPNVGHKAGFAIIVCVISTLFMFRDDRRYIKHSFVFIGVSICSMSIYYISNKYEFYNGKLYPPHVIISQLCWTLYGLLTAEKVINTLKPTYLKSIAGLIFLVALAYIAINRDNFVNRGVSLLRDEKLADFITAVEKLKETSLGENEFVQLWHVYPKIWVTSYKHGSNEPNAKSADVDTLPVEIRPFFLPVSINRQTNTAVWLDNKKIIHFISSRASEQPNIKTEDNFLEPL